VKRFFIDLLDLVKSPFHSRAVFKLESRYFVRRYIQKKNTEDDKNLEKD